MNGDYFAIKKLMNENIEEILHFIDRRNEEIRSKAREQMIENAKRKGRR